MVTSKEGGVELDLDKHLQFQSLKCSPINRGLGFIAR